MMRSALYCLICTGVALVGGCKREPVPSKTTLQEAIEAGDVNQVSTLLRKAPISMRRSGDHTLP